MEQSIKMKNCGGKLFNKLFCTMTVSQIVEIVYICKRFVAMVTSFLFSKWNTQHFVVLKLEPSLYINLNQRFKYIDGLNLRKTSFSAIYKASVILKSLFAYMSFLPIMLFKRLHLGLHLLQFIKASFQNCFKLFTLSAYIKENRFSIIILLFRDCI